MTLYLKYRPQTIKDLDLVPVRNSLKRIVESNNIPHALLFSGPKGIGKTSAARILAKAVNCEKRVEVKEIPPNVRASSSSAKAMVDRHSAKSKRDDKSGIKSLPDSSSSIEPCNKCKTCISITKGENLDVLELDAASHRGIDDIRSLKDGIKLASTGGKKKVYIIDEAHMLTTEASNALLKTLEEPPEHVMFILATTNPEKLIETIRSRAVNIKFRSATLEEITNKLVKVAKSEGVSSSKEALEMIAKHSEGSFRDAIKTLEQIITEGITISTETVGEILFQGMKEGSDEFYKYLVEKNTQDLIKTIEKAVDDNVSVRMFTRNIIEKLREALLSKVGVKRDANPILCKLEVNDLLMVTDLFSKADKEIPFSVVEQLPLEVAVIKWCLGPGHVDGQLSYDTANDSTSSGEANQDKGGTSVLSGKEGDKNSKKSEEPKPFSAVKEESIKGQSSPRQSLPDGITDDLWVRALSEIRVKNSSTEALLRASRPLDFDGKILRLGVYYKFHKEKLDGQPHRDILVGTMGAVLGNTVKVVCELVNPPEVMENSINTAGDFTDKGGSGLSETILAEGGDDDIIKVAEEIFNS
jgi:DNA polymerase III subunit gamma/tau